MKKGMKVTTGIDIIEVERIKEAILEMGDSFLNKNISILQQDLQLKKRCLKQFLNLLMGEKMLYGEI